MKGQEKMKNKIIRYLIVVFSIIAILFALMKLLKVNKKLDTYVALGDYLSVSGSVKGEDVTSFTSLLGEYFVSNNLVSKVNDSYTKSSITSEMLLEMINKDAYNENSEGLLSLIKDSKYVTISVGMNDILQYLRFDSNRQELIYDKEIVDRKLEIMKQNYCEIIEEIKNINENINVYLVSYYYPFEWVNEDNKIEVNEVFNKLNSSIKEVSEVTNVHYVDISEVSKEENMFNKYQIYLNQSGQDNVFDIIKNNYFE